MVKGDLFFSGNQPSLAAMLNRHRKFRRYTSISTFLEKVKEKKCLSLLEFKGVQGHGTRLGFVVVNKNNWFVNFVTITKPSQDVVSASAETMVFVKLRSVLPLNNSGGFALPYQTSKGGILWLEGMEQG